MLSFCLIFNHIRRFRLYSNFIFPRFSFYNNIRIEVQSAANDETKPTLSHDFKFTGKTCFVFLEHFDIIINESNQPSQTVVTSMMITYTLSKRANSNVGMRIAPSMINPPMVGVPCFSFVLPVRDHELTHPPADGADNG